MKIFALTKDGTPPQLSKWQAEAVHKLLQPYGSEHTLDELVAKAEKTNYKALFNGRGAPTVTESLKYHLNRFAKSGTVRITED